MTVQFFRNDREDACAGNRKKEVLGFVFGENGGDFIAAGKDICVFFRAVACKPGGTCEICKLFFGNELTVAFQCKDGLSP